MQKYGRQMGHCGDCFYFDKDKEICTHPEMKKDKVNADSYPPCVGTYFKSKDDNETTGGKMFKTKKWVVFVLILCILGAVNSSLWAGWKTQMVDYSAGSVGRFSSITCDSNDNPHISYYDDTNYDLKYAKWTGTAWSISTVDSTGVVGLYNSIVFNIDNNPRISYYDSTNGDLKYARWTGTAWSTATIDSAGDVGKYTSLAIDTNNNPHIAYYDATNGDLKYARWTGSSWSIQTVDSTGSVGYDTSIALDTTNNPHISYRDATNNDLKYAKWTGTAWSISTVDSTGFVGYDTSIALDTTNNPHISYYDATNNDLKYAKWTGTAWSISTVDSTGSVGSYTSIALDSNNYPYIAYYDDTNFDIKFAKWAGSSWQFQIVDSEGNTNWQPWISLSVDSKNYSHISYCSYGTPSDLKYARWNNNPTLSWTGEVNYISDGLNPETGRPDTTFTFHIKYIDIDSDATESGYPKVHIKKGGVEISGSPFTMSYVSGSYNTGAIYSYSTTLSSLGTNYTYYFEAYDVWYTSASGLPTILQDAPDVFNNVPALTWTGENNYTSDGLDPEIGDRATTFFFRLKYTDVDNDTPWSGYPKVHIKKGGAEISGSPFIMNYISGNYNTGVIYTFSTTLVLGTDFTYYFQAYDSYGAVAAGTPTSPVNAPDVINNSPNLTWTGETNYTNDGLNPDMGDRGTTFYFRIKYTDVDSDTPELGYPKVHIKKGGVEISGSPFTMSYVSGNYNIGAVYSYSKNGLSVGTDYSYYFEAQDIYGATASGTPTSEINAPDVINNSPTLSWTGEANYITDGLDPETGNMSTSIIATTFTYRVKYTDVDNDAPKTGYPKVHIKKGGTEITGSPFTMITTDSSQYSAGKVYSYSTTLSTGTNYTYYFEAYDGYNATATGTPITAVDSPDVLNNSPTLSYTSEANYTSDGLNPETGDRATTFYYRIKYTDVDNDAPKTGYFKVHIKKGGTEITGSPFPMSYVSGNYSTGAIYSYSRKLSLGMDYIYYFEAYDVVGATATGIPTTSIDAPDVTNNAPTLSWTGETNYTSDGLDPESGDRVITFIFKVKYIDVDSDEPASGYPRLHIKKSGIEISGSPFTMSFSSGAYYNGVYRCDRFFSSLGTDYTYYFEAYDVWGATATGTPMTTIIDAPDVTINNLPTLSWTGESNYTSDGVYPDSGNPIMSVITTTFTYRVKYSDVDNDAPASGYPKVHTKKDGVEIPGSPFIMTAVDSNPYTAGRIYMYSILFSTGGTDYSYYFEATDIYNDIATGTTTTINGPIVNSRPNTPLPPTGLTTSLVGTNYYCSVSATDPDSDAVKYGWDWNGDGTVDEWTGLNNSGWTDTKLHIWSVPGIYNIRVKVQDAGGAESSWSGMLTVIIGSSGGNNPPILSWTGESGYISDGLNPETGISTDTFVYKVKYFDFDNDAPAVGYPKVHIKKGGTEIVSSPFTMSYISGNYTTGAIYSYSKSGLSAGNDYTYYFEAYDVWNATATGVPTSSVDAPDIVSLIYTYYIKGYVRDGNGYGINGVTVNLTGTDTKSTTTITLGYYEFTNLMSSGNYTVTPTKTGYSFNPSSNTYTNLSVNQDNQNFVGTQAISLYTLTVNINPVNTGSVVLNPAGGTYLAGSTVTMTATANSGYTFSGWSGDASGTNSVTSVVMNGDKMVTAIFTVSQPPSTYYIKGYVRRSSGAGIDNVTVQLSGGLSPMSKVTDSSGYYEFTGLASGNYTVTSIREGYSFEPANRSYSPLNSNQDDQNFTSVTIAKTAVEETVKPPAVHLSPSSGIRKKIQELKEKIEKGTP